MFVRIESGETSTNGSEVTKKPEAVPDSESKSGIEIGLYFLVVVRVASDLKYCIRRRRSREG